MNESTFKRGGMIRRALGMAGAILLVAFLTGWVTRQAASAPGQAPPAQLLRSPRVGHAFEGVPARSRLIVLVYRAGLLAAFGHKHVVACRCLTGAVYLPSDPLRASFDVHIAVKQLTVDGSGAARR